MNPKVDDGRDPFSGVKSKDTFFEKLGSFIDDYGFYILTGSMMLLILSMMVYIILAIINIYN